MAQVERQSAGASSTRPWLPRSPGEEGPCRSKDGRAVGGGPTAGGSGPRGARAFIRPGCLDAPAGGTHCPARGAAPAGGRQPQKGLTLDRPLDVRRLLCRSAPPRAIAALLTAAALGGCDQLKAFVAGDPSKEERAETLRQKAIKAEAEGNDKAAIAGYEGVRSILINDSASSLALGRLYEKDGNDAQAILSLKAAADVDDNPEIRKRLAAIYLRHGDAAEAARLLKDLTRSDSADLDSQLKLVRTLIVSGKIDDALAQATVLLAKNPSNVDALDLKAEALLAKGQGDAAAQLLDAAVAANPHSVEVRLARARFLSERGLPDKALSELERIDPDSAGRPEVIFAKSDQLMHLKRYDEASKLVGDYIAEHPNDLEALATLATIKVAAGDFEGAQSAAEGVLARMPHNLVALFVRARCLEQSGAAGAGHLRIPGGARPG